MMHQNTIAITQVSNGWQVVLPYVQHSEEEMYIKQARIIKREVIDPQHRDEKLHAIQQIPELEMPKPPKLKDMKIDNIFYFKTFPEVLAFLKYEIDEPK